jgi:hypothetical protein
MAQHFDLSSLVAPAVPKPQAPNEALRLLSEKLDQVQIGVLCGVSKQAVSSWFHRGVTPSDAVKERVEQLVQIDRRLWDKLPGGAAGWRTPEATPDDYEAPNLDADDAAEQLLISRIKSVHKRIHDVEALGTASEYSRLVALESKLTIELAKVRRELSPIDEDKLARTPTFQAVLHSVVTALRPFPEALDAVVAALEAER